MHLEEGLFYFTPAVAQPGNFLVQMSVAIKVPTSRNGTPLLYSTLVQILGNGRARLTLLPVKTDHMLANSFPRQEEK